jgi:ATP-dependent DNA helicase RecG
MTDYFTSLSPVRLELNLLLKALAAGTPSHEVESERVDVKEEPGRRAGDGSVRPGHRTNDAAATYLAGELACLANSGGGAIVLGVSDDGQVIGTEIDIEWLRHRIYELTDRKLTVTASEVALRGARVLEIESPAAIEPIRYRNKIRQRVGKNCVEVDAATWAERQQRRTGFDWSAQPSGRDLSDVRAGALEVARDFLRGLGETAAADLAEATDHDLVRRLGLCDKQGQLVNAGALLLCAGPAVIDYRRREVAGGDAVTRVQVAGRSLLEQLSYVIDAVRIHNPRVELDQEWARGRTYRVPDLAAREALVNGVTHRDWLSPAATEVEHVGDRFTVTSPGGFVGGVSPDNIITHPSAPRYPRLAEALAMLRVAERQGIGVDRMHREMLRLGLAAPVIEELPGPLVRTTLLGGPPARSWLSLRGSLEPLAAADDLDFLLVLDLTARRGWVSGDISSRVLQRSREETNDVLERLTTEVHFRQFEVPLLVAPLLLPVEGDPRAGRDAYDSAWQFRDQIRRDLGRSGSRRHQPPPREDVLTDYARHRGRISSTEAKSLLGLSANAARTILDDLVRDGVLQPGREQRRGRGFFYVPYVPA